jgi:hypothetical protein
VQFFNVGAVNAILSEIVVHDPLVRANRKVLFYSKEILVEIFNQTLFDEVLQPEVDYMSNSRNAGFSRSPI